MTNQQWTSLCDAVGHPEWKDDERFKTPGGRDRYADERLNMTQEALLAGPAEQWLKILEEAGVPCAPVLKRREMINHPQVEASGLIVESDHPVAGRIRQTRPAARYSVTTPEMRYGAPGHGEHNDEVLSEIGMSNDDIATLREKGVIS